MGNVNVHDEVCKYECELNTIIIVNGITFYQMGDSLVWHENPKSITHGQTHTHTFTIYVNVMRKHIIIMKKKYNGPAPTQQIQRQQILKLKEKI